MKSDKILEKMLESDLASGEPTTNVEDKVIEEVKNLETRLNNSMEKKFAEISRSIQEQFQRNAQTGTGSAEKKETDNENTETLKEDKANE